MLKRKAFAQFDAWYERGAGKALLVTGARQVGKSYLINRFLDARFPSSVRFDLIEDEGTRQSFARATSADDLALRISVAADKPLEPGKTVIFIDEVQQAPQIVTYIKYLVQKTDYRYILSGSLLGTELENIRSLPVGYVREVTMFPLDFEEFCWANGPGGKALDIARECLANMEPVPDFAHDQLLALYHRYLLVGGLPDAVQAFVLGRGMDEVRAIHNDIRSLYRQDITKYAPRERRLIISQIFDLVPSELAAKSRRFKIASIPDVKRFTQVEYDFLWLEKAGVVLTDYQVGEPTAPLLASSQHNRLRLFYLDVGLLASTYLKAATAELLDGKTGMNLGGVYENAVAQLLHTHGFSLHYFQSRKIGELDFVIERANGQVAAIEVKSGSQYMTHAALDNALAVPNWHIDDAYVLAETNLRREGRITYLPIYFAELLQP